MPREKRIPLYEKIRQDIAEQIGAASLTPGAVLPTRTELAARYRTAVATVDRALQELTREGLVAAGSGRRTIVAEPSARAATTIAVIMNLSREQTDVSADFLDPLFAGIRMACMEFMLEVHYRSSETPVKEVIEQTKAQGILVIRPDYSEIPRLERLRAEGIPVVAAPGILDNEGIPSISSDNLTGMDSAIGHLVALGHREIGFVSLTATVPDHFERLQGFLRSMDGHGLPAVPRWMYLMHEHRPDQFAKRLEGVLMPGDLPTALVVGDFLMTLAVIRQLNSLGVRVPQDMSLVCFDDPPAAAHIDPALTAIRQHLSKLGYRAVERLVESIGSQDVPLVDRVATELVVRDSTSRPPR